MLKKLAEKGAIALDDIEIEGYVVALRVVFCRSRDSVCAAVLLPWHADPSVYHRWRMESLPRLAYGAYMEGTKMSNVVHLSDVQLLNLSVLMTIQANIKNDPVAACYRFSLREEQARRVEGMGLQQLQAIVANRGNESLFNLREDFWQLLDAPLGLQAALSTVRLADTWIAPIESRSGLRRHSA